MHSSSGNRHKSAWRTLSPWAQTRARLSRPAFHYITLIKLYALCSTALPPCEEFQVGLARHSQKLRFAMYEGLSSVLWMLAMLANLLINACQ